MTPSVALRSDGAAVPLTTHDDIVKYYQAAFDGYRQRGCVACRWNELAMTGMGNKSAVAAVTWTLLRQDGSSLATWRQSYCIASSIDGPKIYASATHA